nr:hypothetical protein [Tanacetum cinerariifolium]
MGVSCYSTFEIWEGGKDFWDLAIIVPGVGGPDIVNPCEGSPSQPLIFLKSCGIAVFLVSRDSREGVLVITHRLKELGKSCDVAGSFGEKWVLAATVLLKSGKE